MVTGGSENDRFIVSSFIPELVLNGGLGDDVFDLSTLNVDDVFDGVVEDRRASGLYIGGGGSDEFISPNEEGTWQIAAQNPAGDEVDLFSFTRGVSIATEGEELDPITGEPVSILVPTLRDITLSIDATDFESLTGSDTKLDSFVLNGARSVTLDAGTDPSRSISDSVVLAQDVSEIRLESSDTSNQSGATLIGFNSIIASDDAVNTQIFAPANTSSIVALQGPGEGTFTYSKDNRNEVVSFSGFDNVFGSPFDDQFELRGVDSQFDSVDGLGGTDQFLFLPASRAEFSVAIDGTDTTLVTQIGSSDSRYADLFLPVITNVERYGPSALASANDLVSLQLLGANVATIWTIGNSAARVETAAGVLSFDGVDEIQAGSSADNFVFDFSGSNASGIGLDGTIAGSSGDDRITVANGDVTWTVNNLETGNLSSAGITTTSGRQAFSGIETFIGSTGNDTFVIAGGDWGVRTIDGRAGTDAIASTGRGNTWTLTGSGSGTLGDGANENTTRISYSNIENLSGATDVGASFSDRFIVQDGSVSGVLNGGNGNDLLDFSSSSSSQTIIAGASSAYNQSFENIETLTGSGNSALQFNDAVVDLSVQNNRSISFGGIEYEAFSQLISSSSQSTLTVASAQSQTVNVTGQNTGDITSQGQSDPYLAFTGFTRLILGEGDDLIRFASASGALDGHSGLAGIDAGDGLDAVAVLGNGNTTIELDDPLADYANGTLQVSNNGVVSSNSFENVERYQSRENEYATLIGPDRDSHWFITSQNDLSANFDSYVCAEADCSIDDRFSFSRVFSIVAGSENDTVITSSPLLTAIQDTSGGENIVDFTNLNRSQEANGPRDAGAALRSSVRILLPGELTNTDSLRNSDAQTVSGFQQIVSSEGFNTEGDTTTFFRSQLVGPESRGDQAAMEVDWQVNAFNASSHAGTVNFTDPEVGSPQTIIFTGFSNLLGSDTAIDSGTINSFNTQDNSLRIAGGNTVTNGVLRSNVAIETVVGVNGILTGGDAGSSFFQTGFLSFQPGAGSILRLDDANVASAEWQFSGEGENIRTVINLLTTDNNTVIVGESNELLGLGVIEGGATINDTFSIAANTELASIDGRGGDDTFNITVAGSDDRLIDLRGGEGNDRLNLVGNVDALVSQVSSDTDSTLIRYDETIASAELNSGAIASFAFTDIENVFDGLIRAEGQSAHLVELGSSQSLLLQSDRYQLGTTYSFSNLDLLSINGPADLSSVVELGNLSDNELAANGADFKRVDIQNAVLASQPGLGADTPESFLAIDELRLANVRQNDSTTPLYLDVNDVFIQNADSSIDGSGSTLDFVFNSSVNFGALEGGSFDRIRARSSDSIRIAPTVQSRVNLDLEAATAIELGSDTSTFTDPNNSSLELNGRLSLAAPTVVVDNRTVTELGNVEANEAFFIRSSGNLVSDSPLTTNNLTADVSGGVVLNNADNEIAVARILDASLVALSSRGPLQFETASDTVIDMGIRLNVTRSISEAGTINDDADITLSSVNSGALIDIQSEGVINVLSDSNIQASQDIRLESNSILLAGDLATVGDIALVAGADVQLQGRINAGSDERFDTSPVLSIEANEINAVNADALPSFELAALGNAVFEAQNGGITIDAAQLNVRDDLRLVSTDGAANSLTSVNTATVGNVIAQNGLVQFANLNSANDINIEMADAVLISGNTTSQLGNIAISVDAGDADASAVTVQNATLLATNGDISIAGNGSAALAGVSAANGTLSIDLTGDVSAQNALSVQNIDVTARALSLDSGLTARGSAVLAVADEFIFGGDIVADSGLTLSSTALDPEFAATLIAPDRDILAGGDVVLENLTNVQLGDILIRDGGLSVSDIESFTADSIASEVQNNPAADTNIFIDTADLTVSGSVASDAGGITLRGTETLIVGAASARNDIDLRAESIQTGALTGANITAEGAQLVVGNLNSEDGRVSLVSESDVFAGTIVADFLSVSTTNLTTQAIATRESVLNADAAVQLGDVRSQSLDITAGSSLITESLVAERVSLSAGDGVLVGGLDSSGSVVIDAEGDVIISGESLLGGETVVRAASASFQDRVVTTGGLVVQTSQTDQADGTDIDGEALLGTIRFDRELTDGLSSGAGSSSSSVSLIASEIIFSQGVGITGDLSLQSSQTVSFDDSIRADAGVRIIGGADIIAPTAFVESANGVVAFEEVGVLDIGQDASGTSISANAINISSDDSLEVRGGLAADGAIAISAQSLALQDLSAGQVLLSSQADLSVSSVNASDTIELVAGQGLSAGELTANSVTLEGDVIQLAGAVTAAERIEAVSANAAQFDGALTSNTVSLTGGSLFLNGAIVAEQDVVLETASEEGLLSVNDAVSTTAGQVLIAAADDFTLAAEGSIQTPVSSSVIAAGTASIDGDYSATESLSIQANRIIDSDPGTSRANIFSDSLTLESATSIGSASLTDSSTLDDELARREITNVNTINVFTTQLSARAQGREVGNDGDGIYIINFNDQEDLAVTQFDTPGFASLETDSNLVIDFQEAEGLPQDKSLVGVDTPGAVFNVGLGQPDGSLVVRVRGDISARGELPDGAEGDFADFAAPNIELRVLGARGSENENSTGGGTIGLVNNDSRLMRIFATDRVLYLTGFALEPIRVAGSTFSFLNPAGVIVNLDDLFSAGGEELIDIEELEEIDPAIFTAIDNFAFDNVSILLPPDQRYEEDEESGI